MEQKHREQLKLVRDLSEKLKELRRKGQAQLSSLTQAGFDFLSTDVEAGMLFARIAEAAPTNSEKRRRNQRRARRAFDTVKRFSARWKLTSSERSELNASLKQLRKRLEGLGEIV